MNVKRYFARTAREAMSRVRAELGEDAIVLKNRPVDGGVEILALADSELSASEPAASAPPRGAGDAAPASPMSTVNFENYVRERQQRRLASRRDEPGDAGASDAAGTLDERPGDERASTAGFGDEPPREERRAPRVEAPAVHVSPGFVRDAQSADDRPDVGMLMNELREMRGALSDQLESLSWFEGVRRRPGQSRMLRRLLQAGFSPSLSRTLANHLPADFGEEDAERWLREALVRNLRIDSPEQTIFDAGGTYALLGPTGVGKTTTAAKIAAQFALKHGAQSVGLITADVYRIGAQDQLRTFGRLLGVPVHVAHDAGTLAEFLHLFMNKKLVLIDTVGVGQRDERVAELLGSLGSAAIGKLVVLNASAQPETLEDVIVSYQAESAAGVVLSKVDEAVKTAGVLDCVIRHRLKLVGVANGQRVPEDWHLPDGPALIEQAMIERPVSAFDLDDSELAMVLAPAAPVELMRPGGREGIGGGRHV